MCTRLDWPVQEKSIIIKECQLKSDTVAVLAVLPRYPRYYRRNGYNFYGITTVLGWNTRDSRADGDQSWGTTATMGLSFL